MRGGRAAAHRLRWDGEAWWLAEPGLHDDETAVRLAVLIDLAWLLLRGSPGPRWLALAGRQRPAHWGALRATLFAVPAKALPP